MVKRISEDPPLRPSHLIVQIRIMKIKILNRNVRWKI